MHLSENALKLKEQNIKGTLEEVKTNSSNVEFIILPYYKSLEAIPNKVKLSDTLNSFISKTDENSTIAILTGILNPSQTIQS